MQGIGNGYLRLIRRFARDKWGQIALLFAIGAMPVLVAASMALDMSNAANLRSKLQAAADSAVLAGATRLAVGAEDADKEDVTLKTFEANLTPYLLSRISGTPAVAIDFPEKVVQMSVAAETRALLGRLVTEDLTLHVDAAAGVSKGTAICMMALNPHAEKALHIQGTGDVKAEKCAVHVNSGDSVALYQNGNAKGVAKSFCVHGDYSGDNFTPPPRTKCPVEADPLAASFAADWEAADYDTLACDHDDLPQINTDADEVTILSPGIYCGGLTIKKGTVELDTGGIYVFRDGPLHVQAHGTLKGSEVSVLLAGDSSTRLISQAGANIVLSARKTEPFKGIAVGQHPDSIPDKENLVIGGGQMEINGILYFPKQPLNITGNGDIGATISQFAIIADTIAIEGNGQLNIKIGENYQEAGLPDLAEADEIVRLLE
jgi:Flp pilus assembly protein TadG